MSADHVHFRDGTPADAFAVAALHAASWRAHYRGSARDAYLDGPIEAERREFWARRLSHPRRERILVLAEMGPRLVGFACAVTGQDARWGTLVDNLHVASDLQTRGLGRALMGETAARLASDAAGEPVHLFVLEVNQAARRFYDRMRGEVVAHETHVLPDGSGVEHPVLRYAWASPRVLMQVAAEAAR